jgi:uncharacterized protein (TIGR03382 family)
MTGHAWMVMQSFGGGALLALPLLLAAALLRRLARRSLR